MSNEVLRNEAHESFYFLLRKQEEKLINVFKRELVDKKQFNSKTTTELHKTVLAKRPFAQTPKSEFVVMSQNQVKQDDDFGLNPEAKYEVMKRLSGPVDKWKVEASVSEAVVEELFAFDSKTKQEIKLSLRKEFAKVSSAFSLIHKDGQ